MDDFKKKVVKWTEENNWGDNDLRLAKDAKRAIRRTDKQQLKKRNKEENE